MGWRSTLLVAIWQIGALATSIYLLFFNDVQYNWWNWIIIVPISLFLGEIWPLYWGIIRPVSWMLFGD